ATNVGISVLLPEQVEFKDAKGPTKPRVEGRQVIFEPFAKLEPGPGPAYEIIVTPRRPGDVPFVAQMTATELPAGPVTQHARTPHPRPPPPRPPSAPPRGQGRPLTPPPGDGVLCGPVTPCPAFRSRSARTTPQTFTTRRLTLLPPHPPVYTLLHNVRGQRGGE